MKKIFFASLLVMASFTAISQIKTPKPSPSSSLKQDVGLTEVTINYSRPSMKGRQIFGGLVPYNTLWRTGANENTTVEFSTPVTIVNTELKAGKYALFTKPGEKSWEVIFYTVTDNWGTPNTLDETKIAAKVTIDVYKMPLKVETFTITVDDLTMDTANIGLMWEDIYVGIPIKTAANETVLANIESVMKNNPTANDYFTSAVYYSLTNQNIGKAKAYMDKAMELTEDPKYWQLRQQSIILAKSGDKKEAIAVAKKSLAKAKAAGKKNYVKLNTESIEEWSK